MRAAARAAARPPGSLGAARGSVANTPRTDYVLPARMATHHLQPGEAHELPDPERTDPARLQDEIRAVGASPVITAVLEATDAALLVLDASRQIVAFNSRVADVQAPEDVLGLRIGEALGCVDAGTPGGCGTSAACTTCGALGAILGCQARAEAVESECLVRTDAGAALELNVRATPVRIDDETFTVVSLRDISAEKRREVLEQAFVHDLLNTVAGLRGWAQRLGREGADVRRAGERIDALSRHIEREIVDHRTLLLAEQGTLVAERAAVRVGDVLQELSDVFSRHPVARERRLDVDGAARDATLVTDRSLLVRVLANMVKNALEATPPGGDVRVAAAADGAGAFRFSVHNAGAIPPWAAARVFQRSFSTKGGRGRGLGTHAMKLLGERYLGGEVSFASTPAAGTTFSIRLPAAPAAAR